MKILQINANYGYGSTGIIMKDIHELISGQPDMESWVAFQRTNQDIPQGIRIGNNFDWKLHALLTRIAGRQGFYSSVPTIHFLRKLDKLKPDIVHLHNLHSNFINISLLLEFLAERKIPTVITMHDCWWFTGKCFHYVDINCNRYITGCGNCPKLSAPPKCIIGDCSSSVFQKKKELLLSIPKLTMVGCSDWICNQAKQTFLKNVNIKRIYNGVDTTVFRPINDSSHRGVVVLGMANKWMSDRNFGIIEKIINNTDAHIRIVGCTDKDTFKLQKYGDRVSAIGFIRDRDNLAKLYSESDIFVNLTHADTLPTVNMESLCCGTPVITYNSTGSPELIDPATGYIVDEDDQDSIIEIIKSKSFPDRIICAENGRTRFDKNKCYLDYIELYRSLI